MSTTDTDSWTTYDAFDGPELDSSLWAPLDLGRGPIVEPDAQTTVAGGTVTVDVARFRNADTESQGLDNCKHVIHSVQGFDLPAAGVARFGVDIAVDHVGPDSGDYRRGNAAFNVLDKTGDTHLVFDIILTASEVYAEHEVLAVPGVPNPFTRVVHDPFLPNDANGDRFRSCCVEIDPAAGRVAWSADGHVLHEAHGIETLPETVHFGFGLFTLLPLSLGEDSRQGGARVSWRNFRYDLNAS